MRDIIKKCFSLLLVSGLLFSLIPAVSAATTGTYIVTAEQTQMLSDASADGSFVCTVYKGTVVEVTDIRYGYGYIYRKSISAGGWVELADLKAIGEEYTEDNIIGIEISLPDKLTYIVGEEEFDKTGMIVCAVYANNDKVEVSDYTLYKPVFDTLGEKKVTVVYKTFGSGRTFSESFSVAVEKVPIKSISAEGNPKTLFVEGQAISFDGLAVRVQYLDGRPDRIFTWREIENNSDFTFTVNGSAVLDSPLAVGTYTVTVSYLYPEYTASYTVEAEQAKPMELQVLSLPFTPYFYSDTKELNLMGLVLKLIYTNDTSETVDHTDCEIIFDAESAVLGNNTVNVRYKGVETQLVLEMREPALVGLELVDPGCTVYKQGDIFNGTDTVVNGVYSSGAKAEISGWEVHSFDTSTVGEKTVELRLNEFSVFYTVYVTIAGVLPGDANLDGNLTTSDARLILRYSVGLESLTGLALIAADRSGDGTIDTADARKALRAAVGLDPIMNND